MLFELDDDLENLKDILEKLPDQVKVLVRTLREMELSTGAEEDYVEKKDEINENLGELEELILLTVAILYDAAYGVAIQKEVLERTNRSLTISTVHSVLSRLEDKGYLNSRYDGATSERGGRRKHLFRVTVAGENVLANAKDLRNSLWNAIPNVAFKPN